MKFLSVVLLMSLFSISAVADSNESHLINDGVYAYETAVCQNGYELSTGAGPYKIKRNDLIIEGNTIRNEVEVVASGTTCDIMGEGEITYKEHTFFDHDKNKLVTKKIADYEIIVPKNNGCTCRPLDSFCRFLIPQVEQKKHLAEISFGMKTIEKAGEEVEVADSNKLQITTILEYQKNEDGALELDSDGNKIEIDTGYEDSRRKYCAKKESDLPPTYKFNK